MAPVLRIFLTLFCLAGVLCNPFDAFGQGRPPPAPLAPSTAPQALMSPQIPPAATESLKDSYVLGTGDRLRIIVYGEPDLSGEFEIDANGAISLPLIGVMTAASQTIRGLEGYVTKRLGEYLRDPHVNLQVTQYRPFFILGEVKQPGTYPFIPGMSVKNAIALAGGYTVRGSRRGISVDHASKKGAEVNAAEEDPVYPGDAIRVAGSLF
jgi:protein involved in polysaccharide export with SLBB domain